MQHLGELTLAGREFPVHHANFRYITDAGEGVPGWEFEICTQPPTCDTADEDFFLFANGVRFYAEGDPIPLPNVDDLTGVELFIKEPFDPKTGDVYFTLYVREHGDVSDVRLKFVERRGTQYLLHLSALAHHIFEAPAPLAIQTWITRHPPHNYL